jgi:hypothetical protein
MAILTSLAVPSLADHHPKSLGKKHRDGLRNKRTRRRFDASGQTNPPQCMGRGSRAIIDKSQFFVCSVSPSSMVMGG